MRWLLAWIVVSVPLTLALTVPATSPDAEYARATVRAEQLGALMSDPSPPAGKAELSSSQSMPDNARYGRYLSARALERRQNAIAFPWSRWLATLEVVLLSICIVPAWLAIVKRTKRHRV